MPRGGIDKYVLIELYAKEGDTYPGLVGTASSRRAAILAAAGHPESWRQVGSPEARHRVDYFESWHLPSGDPEEYEEEYEEDGETKTRKCYRHDGRHVVAVEGENGTLVDEPWDEDHFPILLFTPRKRRRSIWGLSLMRDLIAPQREYEKLTKKIQNQHQKMGVSGWCATSKDEIQFRDITSGTFAGGFVVETQGSAPVPVVTEPVAAGTYAYARSIPNDMLERKGISTLAAASQLPAGLQQASGKALQVYEDFEDVRLLPYHRERERFKIALSWIIVCTARRIVDRLDKLGKKYQARYRGKHGIEMVDWKTVLMDKADFVLKVFPISQLSKQPAALFAQLTEMLERGAINVEAFKRLYGLPDLESENNIDTADTEIIDRNMDIMVTTGRYISPEPDDNFALIIERASKFYNLCRAQEVPRERLKLLLDFKEDTKSLMDQAKAKAANDVLAAGAAAPPMGGPPPTAGPPGMVPPDGPLPGMPGMDPGSPMPPPPVPMAA